MAATCKMSALRTGGGGNAASTYTAYTACRASQAPTTRTFGSMHSSALPGFCSSVFVCRKPKEELWSKLEQNLLAETRFVSRNRWRFAAAVLTLPIALVFRASSQVPREAETTALLDAKASGREFDGIGAFSAGASSRLLK